MFSKFFFRCNFLYFLNDFLQSDPGGVSGLHGKTRVLVRTSLGMRAGQSPTLKIYSKFIPDSGVGDLDLVGSGSRIMVVSYLFQQKHLKIVLKRQFCLWFLSKQKFCWIITRLTFKFLIVINWKF
jgi:hypothetical protein